MIAVEAHCSQLSTPRVCGNGRIQFAPCAGAVWWNDLVGSYFGWCASCPGAQGYQSLAGTGSGAPCAGAGSFLGPKWRPLCLVSGPRTSSFQWFDHAPDCDTPFYKNCRSCGCPSAARGAESSANRRRCRQCGRGSMFSSLKKSGAKTDSVYSLRHFSADSGALTRRNLGDGRTDVPDY